MVRVLGRDARERYKHDIAYRYARNKLTEFRTEERRKVSNVCVCVRIHCSCDFLNFIHV